MNKITIVETPAQVSELSIKLHGAAELAFDTEFHPEGKYRPEPMLLQIGTREQVYLIDPLPSGMRSAIGDLLAKICAQGTMLVGHDLKSDVKILFRLCGAAPERVADTQIAAAFLGFGGSIGLERLAREAIGATMDKSHTLANWATRPLPEPLQTYAAGDVGFMLNLWTHLQKELTSSGRLGWVEDECERLLTPAALQENDPVNAWKSVENRNKVNKRSFAVLRCLAAERERMAQKWNSPAKRILPDAMLVDLARRAPVSRDALVNSGTQRTVRPELERYADHWLAAIQTGIAEPLDGQPETAFLPTPNQEAAIKLIKLFVGDQARDLQMAPELFLSGMDRNLTELITSPLANFDDFMAKSGLKGWRAELVADKLWNFLQGKMAPRFCWEPSGLVMKWEEKQ